MSERMCILEFLESGEISVEEAMAWLEGSAGQRKPDRAEMGLPAWLRRLWKAISWRGVALAMRGQRQIYLG